MQENASHQQDLTRFARLCAISLFIIGLIAWVTGDKIEHNQTQAALEKLQELVPKQQQASITNQTLKDIQQYQFARVSYCSESESESESESRSVYFSLAVVPGYSSQLQVLIALSLSDKKLTLLKARVLPPQSETPGLGDVILPSKSAWIHQFNNHSFQLDPFDSQTSNSQTSNLQTVNSENGNFDTVTGATISTQAVIKGVFQALHNAKQQLSTQNSNERSNNNEC